MAPIIFKRNKAERLPRRIITKDLYHQPQDEDGLSPLEMEKKFVVCRSPEGTTPETVDSMVMTFSDDSFEDGDNEDEDLEFGDACQFDVNWWEEEDSTPAKNNTTTHKLKSMTPFSKLALENNSKRLALSPLDTNKENQLDNIQPIKKNLKDKSWRHQHNKNSASFSSSPFDFSKHNIPFLLDTDDDSHNNCSGKTPSEIKADLDALWKTTKAARQPYVSPFSKKTLARDAEGKHTMPPAHSKSQWVQFSPVKGFHHNNHRENKNLTTPFSKRKNKRGSPLLSPLDRSTFLTPRKEETPEPKKLFNLSLEEEEDVVEIKMKPMREEGVDTSVISGLTKIEEVDEVSIDQLTNCDIWGLVVKEVEDDSFDAGDGLLSNFLHNFMVSTPPKKRS